MAWRGGRSKYKATKVEVDGIVFDSKKEARRFEQLKALEASGTISNLQRQVKFVLIPAQREPDRVGVRGGKIKGKVIEREMAYIADFTYTVTETGQEVVEDVKGFKGGNAYEIFKIKRKLMLYLKGIRIKEV